MGVNIMLSLVLHFHQNKPSIIMFHSCKSVGGVKVSIVAFQVIDPGSIPGQRNYYFVLFFNFVVFTFNFKSCCIIPILRNLMCGC